MTSRMAPLSQEHIDSRNASFWSELCGSGLARALGITEHSPHSLRKFDEAYLGFYPYLRRYVESDELAGARVLEIGLGYGTLGQLLASRGCRYYGLDIAETPVTVMRYRLSLLGEGNGEDRVRQGSALAIPFDDGLFDHVYSIGCLHHTGNLTRAIAEVHRVLKPGGSALIMLYNKYSWRQLVSVSPWARLRTAWSRGGATDDRQFGAQMRARYDGNAKGEDPPHTDYVSRTEVRRLFSRFRHVGIESQNCDPLVWRGRILATREQLLGSFGRLLGLDLYIRGRK
ncbi:MAG: class I SAM-dependent methyltransferase [Nitrospirota bacterium]|nr:class I SAM-dependent methyltransferase [Nitrospirota bacterium]MDE3117378.1 class I SAM-dependent methyltransferase [Nitrospirota bacterium]MDE3241899.1 class I SAM-dependent methyltransferase [Nitrospirota bacterium]